MVIATRFGGKKGLCLCRWYSLWLVRLDRSFFTLDDGDEENDDRAGCHDGEEEGASDVSVREEPGLVPCSSSSANRVRVGVVPLSHDRSVSDVVKVLEKVTASSEEWWRHG